MYTRSFLGESEKSVRLPNGYDGVAFESENNEEKLDTGGQFTENKAQEDSVQASVGASAINGLFSPLGSLFGGLNLRLPRIGGEELLIIATALFLLFSKDGDRECAVILLLLLLVN